MVQRTVPTRAFRGFNSLGKIKPRTALFDIELVKQDLLNNFQTRRGERVMRPNYGSIIWDILFNPLDDASRNAILTDVETIVNSDPRVTLESSNLVEFEHGIRIDILLYYVPFNALQTMQLDFDRRNEIVSLTSPDFVEGFRNG